MRKMTCTRDFFSFREMTCVCIEFDQVSPRVQSYIISLFDSVINSLSLFPEQNDKQDCTYICTHPHQHTHTSCKINEALLIWLQLSPFHRALSTNLAPTFPQKISRKWIREARTHLGSNQIDRSLSCSHGGQICTNDMTHPQMLSRFDFCPCICSCVTYTSYIVQGM